MMEMDDDAIVMKKKKRLRVIDDDSVNIPDQNNLAADGESSGSSATESALLRSPIINVRKRKRKSVAAGLLQSAADSSNFFGGRRMQELKRKILRESRIDEAALEEVADTVLSLLKSVDLASCPEDDSAKKLAHGRQLVFDNDIYDDDGAAAGAEEDDRDNKENHARKSGSHSRQKLHELHSESQRLVREAAVRLPYRLPQQKTVDQFLHREKKVPLSLSKSVSMMTNSLQIKTFSTTDAPTCSSNHLSANSEKVTDNSKLSLCPKLSGASDQIIKLDDFDCGGANSVPQNDVFVLISRFVKHNSLSRNSSAGSNKGDSANANGHLLETESKKNSPVWEPTTDFRQHLKEQLSIKRSAAQKEKCLLSEMDDFETSDEDSMSGDSEHVESNSRDGSVADSKLANCENEKSNSNCESSLSACQPFEDLFKYGTDLERGDCSEDSQSTMISSTFKPDMSNDYCTAQLDDNVCCSESVSRFETEMEVGNTQENMHELVGLCSGRWPTATPAGEIGASGKTSNRLASTDVCESDDSDSSFDSCADFLQRKRKSVHQIESDSEEEVNGVLDDEDCDSVASLNDNRDSVERSAVEDYFDVEAELSGSEASSDEDDDYPTELLEEFNDQDSRFSEDEIKDQNERVHQKLVMDDDQRLLYYYKEMYLENGELDDGGSGRIKRFRWQNDQCQQAAVVEHKDDDGEESRSEHSDKDDDVELRVQRYERETWLRELKKESDVTLNDDGLQNGEMCFRYKLTEDDDQVHTSFASPPKQKKRGSFLSRGSEFLTKVAEQTKSQGEMNLNGAKNSGVFVFSVVSPPTDKAPLGLRLQSKSLSSKKCVTMKTPSSSGKTILDIL